ncbi:hypothetical protein WR25_09873 [Diploscapter pachys]|uniref:Uncharacterized protein n=1 Tax=Diploscapter pachys TaxID=2018661 RepID=A0A2A2LGZ2_9BILA|nr:hypothetical protein WR25_09873 [Diploscapter pachys]
MMYQKDDRFDVRPQSSSSRRKCGWTVCIVVGLLALIGLAIFLGWAGVMLYKHYVSDVNDKRENDDYLRKLVRQVNDSPETTWKAKFNKFGVKTKKYGFTYTRNATAIQEYMDHIKRFFESEAMKRHIQ